MDNHETAQKRSRPALLQLVAGYLLMFGGAALFVIGLVVVKGQLAAIVMVLLGCTLALVGVMVAILAFAQALFGGIVDATEEAVARMQEKQPPTPPLSSAL